VTFTYLDGPRDGQTARATGEPPAVLLVDGLQTAAVTVQAMREPFSAEPARTPGPARVSGRFGTTAGDHRRTSRPRPATSACFRPRHWGRSVKKTCVGSAAVFLMVVTAFGPASGQAESGAAAETTGTVSSPYTFFDTVGDAGSYADITAVRVRNASDRVVLRSWVRNWDPNVWLVYLIDLKVNGPGDDYRVGVSVSEGVRIWNTHTDHYPCISSNVSDLGSDAWGHSVSARFRPRCIGGSRAFRTALYLASGWWVGDRAPNNGYTPWIRRSS
jgi:hypothetical protein